MSATFDFKALTFIKASEIPVTGRFRTSTPKMGISENGQIRFSKAVHAHEAWVGKTRLYVGWNSDTRVLGVMPIGDKLPKGIAETDLFQLRAGTKHPDQYYVAASGILKQIGYDYIASSNQSFDIELGAKGEFAIELPTSLTPKPKTPRAKKAIPASVQAEAGKTTKLPESAAVAATEEDPFEL